MPKKIAPLSDVQARAAKPREKPWKLSDGEGLYLEVQPSGSKLWRLKYRVGGRETRVSLGAYPSVSLRDARRERDRLRDAIREGRDPAAERAAARQPAEAGTFEAVARRWLAEKHAHEVVTAHFDRNVRRLEKHVFPWLGKRPVAELTAPEVLAVLRRIADGGHLETAHRVRSLVSLVMRFAVADGLAERDVTADLRGALPAAKDRHHAAITDPRELGALLRAIEGYSGSYIVRCALKLAALTFVRPGELRGMTWAELDLDAARWDIPAERMKGRDGKRRAHVVPLSRQTVAILRELEPLTGPEGFVLPGERGKGRQLSMNTLNAALRRLGYGADVMTTHGFRATARTLLDEVLGERPDLIEAQLAHTVHGPLGRSYNRTTFLPERARMMQAWADHLDALRDGAEVVPIRGKAS